MAYKDFTIKDKLCCFTVDKVCEIVANIFIRSDKNRRLISQCGLNCATLCAMQILYIYIQNKDEDLTFELSDIMVDLLKSATLSLNKQELENVVSDFLKEPSVNTAQKALKAYNNLAEHRVVEILKDEAKQEINKIC